MYDVSSVCFKNDGYFFDSDLLFCFTQIEILLGKTEKFDELMSAAAEERREAAASEQQVGVEC